MFLTTVINAASLGKMVAGLGLAKMTKTEQHLRNSAKRFFVRKHGIITNNLRNRQDFPDLANVDWATVDGLVGPSTILMHDFDDHDEVFDPEDVTSAGATESHSMPPTPWHPHLANQFLGRYLMSLRCSYSSQFQNGLLSPLAYREIEQALKSAIDHSKDKTKSAIEKYMAKISDDESDNRHSSRGSMNTSVQIEDFRFEWGWLGYERFLETPRWLSYLQDAQKSTRAFDRAVAVLAGPFLKRWTDSSCAKRMEIMLAVARAHECVLRCEEAMFAEQNDAGKANCIKRVLEESRAIKESAENRYASLQFQQPDIACAVRTRHTCQLVLKMAIDELETLRTSAQISDEEHEHYLEKVFYKRQHLSHTLPEVQGGSTGSNLLAYYFSDSDLDHFSKADMSVQHYAEDQSICLRHQEADSIFFIVDGIARLYKDTGVSMRTESSVASAVDEGGRVGGTLPAPVLNNSRRQSRHASYVLPHSRSGDQHHVTEKNEILLSAGCCFNDVEFLLNESGWIPQNSGRLIAVTNVRLIQLKYETLRSKDEQRLNFLQKLWRYSGHAVNVRCPELFNFEPPDEWSWNKVKVSTFAKGERLCLSHSMGVACVLLIKGKIAHTAYNGPLDTPSGQNTTTRHYKPFSFIALHKGENFTVSSESCQVLGQEDDDISSSTDDVDFARIGLDIGQHVSAGSRLRRSSSMTMVERRSMELTRPISTVDTRLLKRKMSLAASKFQVSSQPCTTEPNDSLADGSELRTAPLAGVFDPKDRVEDGALDKASTDGPLPPVRAPVARHAAAAAAVPTKNAQEVADRLADEKELHEQELDGQAATAVATVAAATNAAKRPAERLADLKELHELGLIDQNEFDEQRARIIASI